MKKYLWIVALIAALAMVFVGCDNAGEDGGPSTVTITFDLNVPESYVGEEIALVTDVTTEVDTVIGDKLPAGPTQVGEESLLIYGLVFKGWYSGKSGGTAVTKDTKFSEDTEVYAQWDTWDIDTQTAVIFNYNYDGAPANRFVKGVKDAALGTAFPADPTRPGTVVGKDTANDTWDFKGWKQYDSGAGDTYNAESVMPGTIKDNMVYAYWEPSTGWPKDEPPAGTDLAGAEKVTLDNAWFVVYKFDLPAGGSWINYGGITVDYMFGPAVINGSGGAQVRAIRLMGNYVAGDFELASANEGVTTELPNIAVASYNNNKNAQYIFDDLGQSWKPPKEAFAALGIPAATWQWITVPYKIDGSRKNGSYVATNQPANADAGPFYFGIGIAGQGGGGNTQWIRNVTLVGNTGTASVTATPLWFSKDGKNYPAFTGYPDGSGDNGFKEAYRGMVDGSQPTPVPVP
jgi:hypothetical protein